MLSVDDPWLTHDLVGILYLQISFCTCDISKNNSERWIVIGILRKVSWHAQGTSPPLSHLCRVPRDAMTQLGMGVRQGGTCLRMVGA